jgi:cytochrome c556
VINNTRENPRNSLLFSVLYVERSAMETRQVHWLRWTILGVLVLCAAAMGALAQDEPLKSRAVFMRQKLELSKNVLEGLATENYELIDKNAKLLKRASMAAEWEVKGMPIPNEYTAFTAEFQRLCADLTKAAQNKNLDGATLAYVRLTTNCVDCHKYVRAFVK